MADWLSLDELEDLLQTMEAEEIRRRYSRRLSPEGLHLLTIFEGLDGELAGLARSNPPTLSLAKSQAAAVEPPVPAVQLPRPPAGPARGLRPLLFNPLLGSLAAVLLLGFGVLWYQRAGKRDFAVRLQQLEEHASGQGAKVARERSMIPGKGRPDEAADLKQALLEETSQNLPEQVPAGKAALPGPLEPSGADPAREWKDNRSGPLVPQTQSQEQDAPRRKLDLESQAWPAPSALNEDPSELPPAPAPVEERAASPSVLPSTQPTEPNPAEPNPAEHVSAQASGSNRQHRGASGQSESGAAAANPAMAKKGAREAEVKSLPQTSDAGATIGEATVVEAERDFAEPAGEKAKARKEEAPHPMPGSDLSSAAESAETAWLQRFASAWRSGSTWSGLFAEDARITMELGPPHGVVDGWAKFASLKAQDVQGHGLDLVVRWPDQRVQRLRARIELDEKGLCRLLHLR